MKRFAFALPVLLALSIHATAAETRTLADAGRTYFTELELVDQNGKPVRFYSDVLQGKTVVINTFFTRCTGICPVMNSTFAKIQDAFGDRLGKDLFMVSISVDPEYDTPERLREYAKNFKASPGWIFLTGKRENVEAALLKLGHAVEAKESHKAVFLIGNEPRGYWKKAFGLAKAADVIPIVKSVLTDGE